MKKSLRKPENWQDFESLCKKLWGEVWNIPNKIKKNGRLGQQQNGVDIYGIPENEKKYWGVQCKGKDDYSNSKLTEPEIDKEVQNAKDFKPELEVFIIATTQNKDSKIEEYVRKIDLENRESGSFEIILFCWEDIVDLIEENRETINWYQGINQYREKYDFAVGFEDGGESITINPKFLKEITKYRIEEKNMFGLTSSQIAIPKPYIAMPFQSQYVNHSWCSVKIILANIGNVVLENWHLTIFFDDNVRTISDGESYNPLLSIELRKIQEDNRTLFVYEDAKKILYEPVRYEPLIQKSARSFKTHFIPKIGAKEIKLRWELLARDFDKEGELIIKLDPEFEEKTLWVGVENKEDLKNDKIDLKEYRVERN